MSQAEHDRRIDYVELGAIDIEATKRFYSAVFGWEFTDYGADYTAFHDGRLSGGFAKVKSAPRKSGTLVVIYAVDLEAMQASIQSAGGRITKKTFAFPGGRRFQFKDPGGNELAVWSDQ